MNGVADSTDPLRLLTVSSLARSLGRSLPFTRDLTKQPGFPAPVRINSEGRNYWRASDVAAWLESQATSNHEGDKN